MTYIIYVWIPLFGLSVIVCGQPMTGQVQPMTGQVQPMTGQVQLMTGQVQPMTSPVQTLNCASVSCVSPPCTDAVILPGQCCPICQTGAFADKPGACPRLRGIRRLGQCVEMCSSDASCPGRQKCCTNRCGFLCAEPVDGVSPQRPQRPQRPGIFGQGNQGIPGRFPQQAMLGRFPQQALPVQFQQQGRGDCWTEPCP